MKNKWIHMYTRPLLLALMLLFPSYLVSAEEATEQTAEERGTEKLSVSSRYSEGIEAHNGDVFTIAFTNSDSGESSTIEIDASDISESYQDYELPIGSYEVTNIIYSGSNETIIDDGYGTENTFRLQEGEGDLLRIYIGETEVTNLENDYSQAVIKDDEHNENGERIVFEDRSGKYRYVEDASNNSVIEYLDEGEESGEIRQYSEDSEEPSGDESAEQETTQEGAEEPVTEYYEETETKGEGIASTLIVIGAVVVIALVGSLIVYILHKKGFI